MANLEYFRQSTFFGMFHQSITFQINVSFFFYDFFKKFVASKTSDSENDWAILLHSVFCTKCVWRSNVKWTKASFGVFYTTTQFGEPGNLWAVTFFGLFYQSMFPKIGITSLLQLFFEKYCGFTNIGLRNYLSHFFTFCLSCIMCMAFKWQVN